MFKFEALESRVLLAADLMMADFNADQAVDAFDIDLLAAEVRSGGSDLAFDLTQDGVVSDSDIDYIVESLLQTRYGDTDLDRDVDIVDFLRLVDGFSGDGGWSNGNFDVGERTEFADFLLLAENFGFQGTTFSYTSQAVDGNRYVEGWGNLDTAASVDIPVGFVPEWVLGAPVEGRQVWVAVGGSGESKAFEVDGDIISEVDVSPVQLPDGVPPLLEVTGDSFRIVTAPEAGTNFASHPVRFGPDLSQVAFIDNDGNLVIQTDSGESQTIAMQVVSDSRILSDGEGRLLLLTDPTTRYPHGIFGIRAEPSSLTLIDTNEAPIAVTTINVPANRVIESRIPLWVDINNDGQREIIVTLSDSTNGGQITAYDQQGQIVMQGPGVGRGFRWRHPLAVAPIGPEGELELVNVRTPHIGGVVEFRSLQGDDLSMVGSVAGYTSHVNRSPNIDMSAAGDFDADGTVELLLPNQRRNTLAGISRTVGGAVVDWEVPIGNTLTSNVAVLQSTSGQLSVGVGRADGTIRIWRRA